MFAARDFMRADVVTVRAGDSIQEAIRLIESAGVSGLPVVDDAERIVGVITDFDLLQAVSRRDLSNTVEHYMSDDPVVVDEDAPLTDVAELFLARRVRRVPVTRDGNLVGIISRRDLIFMGQIRQQILDDLPVLTVAPT